MNSQVQEHGAKNKPQNYFLVAGGIIEIILAFICMVFGVFATAIFLTETLPQTYEFLIQNAVGIVGLVAFGFGVAGGFCALKRKYFQLAILGNAVTMVWAILFAELALIAPSSYGRLTGVMFGMFIFIFSILSLVFIVASQKR